MPNQNPSNIWTQTHPAWGLAGLLVVLTGTVWMGLVAVGLRHRGNGPRIK